MAVAGKTYFKTISVVRSMESVNHIYSLHELWQNKHELWLSLCVG